MVEETITDYETVETERTQYRSDLTGGVIPEGEVATLPVNPRVEQTEWTVTVELPNGELREADDDAETVEKFLTMLSEQPHAQGEKTTVEASGARVESDATIHLAQPEVAEMCDVDEREIDAVSDLPNVYVKTANPEVVERPWIRISDKMTDVFGGLLCIGIVGVCVWAITWIGFGGIRTAIVSFFMLCVAVLFTMIAAGAFIDAVEGDES